MTAPTARTAVAAPQPSSRTAAGGSRDRSVGRALLDLARPGQWHKNVLVLGAPVAGGLLRDPAAMGRAAVMVAAFVAASVAVYATNDVRDADLDRLHPRKRHRPVASGRLRSRWAITLSVTAAAVALGLSGLLGAPSVLVVAAYLASSLAYAFWFKHVAVLDIVLVAGGFALRALGGAAATHLAVSNWFLLVTLFGSLCLVAGKRSAEGRGADAAPGHPAAAAVTRPVLAQYPTAWLQQVLTLALTGCFVAYAMWAFQYVGTDVFHPLLAASVVPFLIGVLRYGLLVSQGDGEEPERVVLRDRTLLAAGAVWAGTVVISLYLT
ncbi:decaprenyl-phosphate phosphoribosyltransferase [Kineosporia sp. A_224]|uniref:decaprenyl-phosphate phosphoribosyltransferase n=1 Tax=Kineosporia sp. A_224 TaxID=1962180 RepID=UPI000B4A6B55|nr:decaprenyl-phosphate phosphoribosyltransferase [Kineosporia sp. A_224]